jgi:hypothetical protein
MITRWTESPMDRVAESHGDLANQSPGRARRRVGGLGQGGSLRDGGVLGRPRDDRWRAARHRYQPHSRPGTRLGDVSRGAGG